MKNPVGTLGAAAAGALAMYYLDPDLGARRRALLAELVRNGLPGDRSAGRGRSSLSPGVYHRQTQSDPQSDAELRGRIQERLDRVVSHPRAITISVENGVVRLSGHVLVKERDGVLEQVQQMAGVQKLVNAMTAHDLPQDIASQSDAELAPAPLAI